MLFAPVSLPFPRCPSSPCTQRSLCKWPGFPRADQRKSYMVWQEMVGKAGQSQKKAGKPQGKGKKTNGDQVARNSGGNWKIGGCTSKGMGIWFRSSSKKGVPLCPRQTHSHTPAYLYRQYHESHTFWGFRATRIHFGAACLAFSAFRARLNLQTTPNLSCTQTHKLPTLNHTTPLRQLALFRDPEMPPRLPYA